MLEPGLDRHEWESRWQQLEEDLATDAAEALSEADRLLEEMLGARGYALDDPVAREGDDRDVVADFLAARDITRPVERGGDVEKEDGDVAAATCRGLSRFLVSERSAT